LTAAALLAKAGRKVLVLEKHGKAGGACHVFKSDGEWHNLIVADSKWVTDKFVAVPWFVVTMFVWARYKYVI